MDEVYAVCHTYLSWLDLKIDFVKSRCQKEDAVTSQCWIYETSLLHESVYSKADTLKGLIVASVSILAISSVRIVRHCRQHVAGNQC